MANMCSNAITIMGTPEELDEVLNFVSTGDVPIDFNKIVPMPEHQPDPDKPNPFWRNGSMDSSEVAEKFGENNWYDWAKENWGTTWYTDAYVSGNTIGFETAWTPATPIAQALSEEFPDLIFEFWYQEEGMDFSGDIAFHDGEIISEDIRDYAVVIPTGDDLYEIVVNVSEDEIIERLEEVHNNPDLDEFRAGGLWDFSYQLVNQHYPYLMDHEPQEHEWAASFLYEELWERAEALEDELSPASRISKPEDFDALSDEDLDKLSNEDLEYLSGVMSDREEE